MEEGMINMIERLGSLGLLGWLLVWATGTAWPKLAAHLDAVSAKLENTADQPRGRGEDIRELRSMPLKPGGGGGPPPPALTPPASGRRAAAAATGGGR